MAFQGCQAPIIRNANDPDSSKSVPTYVARQQLRYASDFLNLRVARNEISDKEAQSLLASTASELISHLDTSDSDPKKMWEYAEIYRTARRWTEAEKALRIAVKNAINEDRRINDSLRLAQAVAMLRRPHEAIEIARGVLNAKPQESAPILPAVLLEIVPSAIGQGVDLELAQLLVDAIKKHLATLVDMSTDPGMMFMQARPFHVKKAKDVAIRLFEATGHHKEALETAAIVVPRVRMDRPGAPNSAIDPTNKMRPMAPVLEGLPTKL